MATAVSICSNALLMLGEKPINSFDDANTPGGLDRARIASNLWPSTRDFLLRSHPWNCALKRVLLSPTTEAPPFGFSHQFLLPGDWLRNHEINGAGTDYVDHVVESGYLLLDGTTCKLRYIWKNESPESWDPMLVYCAQLAMSVAMAYAITSSTTKEQLQISKLSDALRQARAVDGQDESPQTLGSFDILTARKVM